MRVKRPGWWMVSTLVACLVFLVYIFGGYRFGWRWTGFLNKTFWDWMQLLIIPIALALVALLFNLATTRSEQKITQQRYQDEQNIAEQRYQNDQKIALDKQREDLLQVYLDRMSELLLKENLRSSDPNAEVRNVARVRTITILFQLDARRIGYVFAFLRESSLMSNKSNSSIVSLNLADLRQINFSQAILFEADLSGAKLSGARLNGADLNGAVLIRADLSEADLSGAKLNGADLSNTKRDNTPLTKEQIEQVKPNTNA